VFCPCVSLDIDAALLALVLALVLALALAFLVVVNGDPDVVVARKEWLLCFPTVPPTAPPTTAPTMTIAAMRIMTLPFVD